MPFISISKQKKQVLLLYFSSLAGVMVGFLASIINTRALVPESYGDVRYVQNIISFLSSLLLLGYFVSGSRLLAISKDRDHSRRICGLLCLILLVSIAIVTAVLFALSIRSRIAGDDSMAGLFLLAMPVCGNVLMLNYVNTVFQGSNEIGRMAVGRFLPTGLYCLVAFLLFKYCEPTSGTVLFLFNGISTLVLAVVILSSRPSFKSVRETFRILKEENRSYGLDVYFGSLINVSTGYISGITLGLFGPDNTTVGYYTLALTLSSPLSMLPAIIGTTYFKRFASEGKIDKKVFVNSIMVSAVSLVAFLAVVGFVVGLFYDESYSSVSTYASLLAVGTTAHGMADMINRFLGAHGQGAMLRNSAIVSGIVTITGSFVLVYFFGVFGAIATKILASLIYLLTMILFYRRFTSSR